MRASGRLNRWTPLGLRATVEQITTDRRWVHRRFDLPDRVFRP